MNTDRKQCWGATGRGRVAEHPGPVTQKSKELGMKRLQVLVVLDDMADAPQVHKKTGDGILDTLFIRGRHNMCAPG